MLNGTARKLLFAVISACMVEGCDVEGASRAQPAAEVDWRLTREGVVAVDAASGNIRAEIKLPDWLWAKEPYVCAPVVARGPQGEAVITSNVTTTLWRVDPRSFEVTVHEPAGADDRGIEFGFTALTYSPEQQAFFAAATVPGPLWRIDPQLRQARKITASEALSRGLRRTGYVSGRPC
jgi:hypothetical protein